jgi:UDP-N-acetylglucosamine acyltransferase
MSDIHPTAMVDPKAELGKNVKIGPNTIIEPDVIIEDNVTIGANCLVGQYTELKKGVKLFHGAVVGTIPQDLKFKGEKTKLIIGENTIVREYAMFNRGTAESGATIIGENCLLMAYTHIAHDCRIGNSVILVNTVQISGHVEIDDYAIVGGVVPVHQFVKIGAHAMIGGGFRVQQDVCAYALAAGYPLKIAGINSVGLRRRGFSKESITNIEKAFKFLFYSGMNTSQAVEKIQSELPSSEEMKTILRFIERSNRGLVK